MISDEEIGFFARNGYLQKRRLVDPEYCRALVDLTWQRLPAHWSRNEPSTWKGIVEDTCHTGDVNERRGHLRFQRGNVMTSDVVQEAFGIDGKVGQLAYSLLGHPLAPMRTRGLYVIAPLEKTDDINPITNPHIEAHASQLIALCYLEKVEPQGGGLLVWPGSHRELYPSMGSKLEHVRTAEHDQIFAAWRKKAPIELHGEQGDVVIIHHRLMHAPNLNKTNRLRLGFLCDYERRDAASLCGQKPGDIWEDWPAIAALPRTMTDSPCDFQLSPIPDGPRLPQHHAQHHGASTVRSAAAVFARARQPGAIWLTISDSNKLGSSNKLDPLGSRVDSLSLGVSVNGKEIASQSEYDFVASVELASEDNRIEITGIDRPLWLRLLKIETPFANNKILHLQNLNPGQGVTTIRFEQPTLADPKMTEQPEM